MQKNFHFSDLKYLLAYSIPISALLGLTTEGFFYFLTPIYIFIGIPVVEAILTFLKLDDRYKARSSKDIHWIFNWMLYVNIFLVYGVLIYALIKSVSINMISLDFLGILLTVGLVIVSNGINVAHELCHRTNSFERFLGKFLLIPSLYMHFYLEHNFGHHLNVATPNDPVTAKYNEPLYSFWISAVFGELKGAIKIQRKRLQNKNLSFFSLQNDMLWYGIIQFIFLTIGFTFFGFKGLILIVTSAIIAILMFESVNYIEHYGLLRKKLNSGRYERVQEKHSWNSNHIIGRIVLYELTRHSDHHRSSIIEYQNLKSIDDSPQLPFGYPTSILISFIPVLWFKIMNPRVPKEMISIASKNYS